MKQLCFPKLLCLSILFIITTVFFVIISISPSTQQHTTFDTLTFNTVKPFYNDTNHWKKKCQFHTCFEINDCQLQMEDRISVYIYPEHNYKFADKEETVYRIKPSREYLEILATIQSSEYYEPSPSKACVMIPNIDTLSQQRINCTLVSLMLQTLPWWNNGSNHLIFSMLPGQYPSYNNTPDIFYGQAMIAGSTLDSTSYRMGYDISMPLYNSLTRRIYTKKELDSDRPYLLTVLVQLGTDSNLVQHFMFESSNDRVILLGSCEYCKPCQSLSRCGLNPKDSMWEYPSVLLQSTFCLVLPGYRKDTTDFLDILMAGCVPVLLRNTQQILPFSEVLDWERGVVWIWKEEFPEILNILRNIPPSVRKEKRLQIRYLYDLYFSSMRSITMTTLHILNGRVFPLAAGDYESWNNRPYDSTMNDYYQHSYSYSFPLELPPGQLNEGFTAIILTYNRLEMLFQTIASVSRAPSLAMIIVVWNNLNLSIPKQGDWPAIAKPLRIIKSQENKLSNRFYPYDEIKTSAVLSLDDDITMLTASEIEFGYRVWLEYPKQIVGYPGRVHWYDGNERKWKYESEWTNNISIVLTGAAFYHKYYNYMYTYKLPSTVRTWIDDHFNCEDIVFNFMVSNYTGLPPIKITPRKKFKCKDCTNDGLGTDVNHFEERNKCINIFAALFDRVPLKTVKFRLDPVLLGVSGVDESLGFPDIGEL